MTFFNPSYLVQSRHGIWYFQVQIPPDFRKHHSRTLIRRSLRTRDRNVALSLSKYWYLKVIELNYDLSSLDKNLITHNGTREPRRTLTDCIEEFISEKKRGWKDPHSYINETKDYRPKLMLLAEIVGDVLVKNITKSDIVKYKNVLFRLPSNRNKKPMYSKRTIEQLIEMDISPHDLLSNTTISNHFVKVASFLSWLSENDLAEYNLCSPLKRVIKKDKSDSELRSEFNGSDLSALFNNNYYLEGRHRYQSHYWIPLLALFTGARLNELCQLDSTDIVKIDGIWCIDVNSKNRKRLKNLSSARVIPLHSTLIVKLSFLDFVKSQTNQKLFPELKESQVGHGQSFSKWFNRTYRKNVGVGQCQERKDFHSFRHTFANYFKQMEDVQEYRVSEILGHKGNSTITYSRYGKNSSLESKKLLIESLEYPMIRFDDFDAEHLASKVQ
jgi:integrase